MNGSPMTRSQLRVLSDLRSRLGTYISTDAFERRGPGSRFAFSLLRGPLWFFAGVLQRGIIDQVKFALGPGYLKPQLYPNEYAPGPESLLPEIEALIVVAGKDFDVLPLTLLNLQQGSRNRITTITLVTPATDLERCKRIVSGIKLMAGCTTSVVNEDDLFEREFRSELKERFKDRYGWVLQQLLTTKCVFLSQAPGVLVVDADTILLKPRTWLTEGGVQPLLVSREFHASYYKFLETIGLSKSTPSNTHVTHHMLMQPHLLRRIFELSGILDVEDLGRRAINAHGLDVASPVCLEYEVYAQGLVKFFPTLPRLVRFSNAGVSLDAQSRQIQTAIETFQTQSDFFSISLHTYLQASADSNSRTQE